MLLNRARCVDVPSLEAIRIATLATERAQRGEAVVRELYELEALAGHDEPAADPDGVMQFQQFVSTEIDSPNAVPEANFLAFDGARLVGVSRLSRDTGQPGRDRAAAPVQLSDGTRARVYGSGDTAWTAQR